MKFSKYFFLFMLIAVFSFMNISAIMAQTIVWSEDFPYCDGTTKGSGTPPKWTASPIPSWCNWNPKFEVQSNQMIAKYLWYEKRWTSEAIDISAFSDLTLSVDVSNCGNMEGSDFLKVYYRLDGGPMTLFAINGNNTGNFPCRKAEQKGLSGKRVILIIVIKNNAPEETHRFDNICIKHDPPKAGFKAVKTEVCSGDEVVLINKSCGAVLKWKINWGDGTVENGTFPVRAWKHVYTTDLSMEKFSVQLFVEGRCDKDWEGKKDYITVHGPTVTDFIANRTKGVMPMRVRFRDLSKGWITWWRWDFGDGTTSRKQNPVHCYDGTRKHITVTLISGGPCGKDEETKVNYITVNKEAYANLEGGPIAGSPGMEVQFTNKAAGGANNFLWDYGDGCSEQYRHGFANKVHPTHIYEAAGEFDVSLKASGNGGEDILTIPGMIYVDAEYDYLNITLLDAGETMEGHGWDNLNDNDVYGDNSSVLAKADDAWAIYKFDGMMNVHKIRMLIATAEDYRFCTNWTDEISISDSMYCNGFTEFFHNILKKKTDGEWHLFELDEPVRTDFIKIKLLSSIGDDARYREIAEIQFFGEVAEPLPGETVSEAGEFAKANLPTEYSLSQNYPNPFNPETNIRFELPEKADVTLSIYNMQGQLINTLVNGDLNAGSHNFTWNATNNNGDKVAGGVYIYKLNAMGASKTITLTSKMILMK